MSPQAPTLHTPGLDSPDFPAIDAAAAALQLWDAVVIGAGPAGAMAALRLARQGARVLLVEKQRFPRPKVCGCCLNAAALELLAECGLTDLTSRAGAQRLSAIELGVAGKTARLGLPTGAALSRERLDALLVGEAIAAGASFLPATAATVGPVENNRRRLSLSSAGQGFDTAAKVILVADGLGGRALRECPESEAFTAAHARVGGNAVLAGPIRGYGPGVIYMACARGGYVGLVVLEGNRVDLAAAIDVDYIRRRGGLARSAARILAEAGFPPVPGLEAATWHGTPRLTARRRPLAFERVFLIGDAAGYVEPLTGEGMAWAMATGTAVVPFALAAMAGSCANAWGPPPAATPRERSLADGWAICYRRLLAARQRRCHVITRLARHPAIAWLAVVALARFPILARPTIAGINRPLLRPAR